MEGFGHIHGILTGHGIHHQQGFIHLHGLLDVYQLLHELFVDLQSACGIQNHNVVAVVTRTGQRLLGDHRGLFGAHGKHRHMDLLAQHLQLINGGRAVHIAGNQQRAAAFF